MASGFSGGAYRADLAAADTAGGVLSLANPEGVPVFITRVVLNVTTTSTAAATLDIGVGASATTLYDTLIDGVDVGTAVIVADNIVNKGTNGKEGLLWPAAYFLTASKASGAAAGLVGELIVEYVRLD
jgi:hypothetical protein